MTIVPVQNASNAAASPNNSLHTRQTLTVHSMLGHKHIALAARCLGSLARFSPDPVHFLLHEDGSVTEGDREAFLALVPGATFVLKKDADGPMNEFLARYPACRRLRDNLVFGLKIFDIQVLGTDANLAYTDCDILFLRPFTGMFEMPPDAKAGGVFMEDEKQAYCLTPMQLLRTPGLQLASRLNGGLLYFRRAAFDWDLMEWFLTHDEFKIHPYWKEQTAWSVLAQATGSWKWDVKQVRVIRTGRDLEGDDVAVAHFVSSYRTLLDTVPLEGTAPDAAPVAIRSAPGKRCTYPVYVLDELRRKGIGAISRLRKFSGLAG
jgi:hypothetical protein